MSEGDDPRDAMSTSQIKRVHVRIDKYAPFDLGRECRLNDRERWMLVSVCLAADWRDHCLRTTLYELSEQTGTSRTTVPKILKRLEAAELIHVHEPFRSGSAGLIEIVAWDRLVAPTPRRQGKSSQGGGAPLVRESLSARSPTNREPIAQDFANDQAKRPPIRQQGNKDVRNAGLQSSDASRTANHQRSREEKSIDPQPDLSAIPNLPTIGFYQQQDRAKVEAAMERGESSEP